MGLGPLIGRPALRSLLAGAPAEQEIGAWFAWYLCAFLLGGAVVGWNFGLFSTWIRTAAGAVMPGRCYCTLSLRPEYALMAVLVCETTSPCQKTRLPGTSRRGERAV